MPTISRETDYRTFREPKNQSEEDLTTEAELEKYWESSPGSEAVKLQNFPKYARREDMTRLFARAEIFQKQLNVHGSIIDLGVARGASLFTWLHLSSVYEPVNYTRQIIGFDTFDGIPHVYDQDTAGNPSAWVQQGGFRVEGDMMGDIQKAAAIHDRTRFLGHIPKVSLVPGDIELTLPRYLDENPHLVVSLLNVDTDVYGPTKVALELLVPRMPRGAVILFDQLGSPLFPGETCAVQEVLGLRSCSLRRLSFAPALSYVVIDE